MSALSKMSKSQIEFLMRSVNDPEAAKQFGVTRQAIYSIRKKFGIPSSKSKTETRIARIVEMKRQGAPAAKIADTMSMSQSYVYKILRKYYGESRTEPSDKNP